MNVLEFSRMFSSPLLSEASQKNSLNSCHKKRNQEFILCTFPPIHSSHHHNKGFKFLLSSNSCLDDCFFENSCVREKLLLANRPKIKMQFPTDPAPPAVPQRRLLTVWQAELPLCPWGTAQVFVSGAEPSGEASPDLCSKSLAATRSPSRQRLSPDA